MKARSYFQKMFQKISQRFLLTCCLLILSCAQCASVSASEQFVSLEIDLEDENTSMEGVVFSMYRITDNIVPKSQGMS